MSNKNAKEAKEALVWYLRLAAAGAYNFDSDNQVEIERIVDDIIAAAVVAAVAEIKAASERQASAIQTLDSTRGIFFK